MMKRNMRRLAVCTLVLSLTTCMAAGAVETEAGSEATNITEENLSGDGAAGITSAGEQAYIEETLNLANNDDVTWSYSSDTDAWVMSIVSAVAYPELPDQQGVSVCARSLCDRHRHGRRWQCRCDC